MSGEAMTSEELAAIDARLALFRNDLSLNHALDASLARGAAAQFAFETAEASGVASEPTCWAEAADAAIKHSHAREDLRRLRAEVDRLGGENERFAQATEAMLRRSERALERAEKAEAEVERLQGLVAQAGVLLAKAQKERDAARAVLAVPEDEPSLRLGKIAKEAWQRAADTGLAAEMTCWAEAADAVVADLRERAGGTP